MSAGSDYSNKSYFVDDSSHAFVVVARKDNRTVAQCTSSLDAHMVAQALNFTQMAVKIAREKK